MAQYWAHTDLPLKFHRGAVRASAKVTPVGAVGCAADDTNINLLA